MKLKGRGRVYYTHCLRRLFIGVVGLLAADIGCIALKYTTGRAVGLTYRCGPDYDKFFKSGPAAPPPSSEFVFRSAVYI